jgi:hypothetical protein
MFAGTLAGAALGATVGLVIGVVVFRPGSLGMWLVLLAAMVGTTMVGWFLGGIGSLRTPRPGEEPQGSETRAAGSEPDEPIQVNVRARGRDRAVGPGRE